MFKYLLICFVFLTGCATTQEKTITVKEKEVIYSGLQDRLVRKCEFPTPPNKLDYMAASVKEREQLQSNYILDLMANLSICAKQIEEIKTFDAKQKALYGDRNDKVK